MSFRSRTFLLAASVLLGALVVVGALLQTGVFLPRAQESRERILTDLDVAAELARSWEDLEIQEVGARLSELLDYRVTFISIDGTILSESGIPDVNVLALEDHGDRPEVAEALAGTRAVVERRSASLGRTFLFAAEVIDVGGTPVVLRIGTVPSLPTAPIRYTFGVLVGVALVGTGLLWVITGLLVRPLRGWLHDLAERIRQMSDGRVPETPVRSLYPPELGELVGAIGVLTDELPESIARLERERDEMQALIDSIAEGVIALTGDARILRMNDAAEELLDVVQPPPFAPVGTLVRNPELREHLEASVLRSQPSREIRLGDRHLLVSTRWLDGKGSVVTFLDVTELRRIEQVRRDFVANASHELKTPLTAMRGFAEALLEGDPPEHLRAEFLNSICSNTVRLQRLVDDLLDLSRLESGTWQALEEEVEVAGAAREAWTEVLDERSDVPEVEFAVDGDALALADGQALHQIFRNLFDNALRFTGAGGRVRVTVSGEGKRVQVAVSDTGSGIPYSTLPRIFERFYRGDSGRDRAAGGTGLGLAIVRHLVQSMGGEVHAESRLGQGTTIRFTLTSAHAE